MVENMYFSEHIPSNGRVKNLIGPMRLTDDNKPMRLTDDHNNVYEQKNTCAHNDGFFKKFIKKLRKKNKNQRLSKTFYREILYGL